MMKLKLVPFLVKLMKLVVGIISSILLLSLFLFFWIQSIDEEPYFDRKLNHDLLAEVTTTGLNLPSRGNNVYINDLLVFNSYGLYVDDIKKFDDKIVIYLKRDLQVKKDEDINLNLHFNKYTINGSIYYFSLTGRIKILDDSPNCCALGASTPRSSRSPSAWGMLFILFSVRRVSLGR